MVQPFQKGSPARAAFAFAGGEEEMRAQAVRLGGALK
jgi:hypothetical protein